MLSYLFPPESAIAAHFLIKENLWMDDDGEIYSDLKEFGFTTLQRNTILKTIHMSLEAEYMLVINKFGELIEIFWEKGE